MFGNESLQEAMKMNIVRDIYHDPKEREVFIEQLLKEGAVRNYKVTLKRKDGTLIHGETSSHLLYNDAGEAIAVEGIAEFAMKPLERDELARAVRSILNHPS